MINGKRIMMIPRGGIPGETSQEDGVREEGRRRSGEGTGERRMSNIHIWVFLMDILTIESYKLGICLRVAFQQDSPVQEIRLEPM